MNRPRSWLVDISSIPHGARASAKQPHLRKTVMKTLKLRVWSLGLVLLSLLFTVGCHEDRAKADAPVFPAPLIGEADKEAPPPPLVDATLAAEGPVAPVPGTNAPASPPRIVQDATVPSNLKTSPAMAEIIKLVQAGVSEEVILSY